MKKFIILLLTIALICTLSITLFACDNQKGEGKTCTISIECKTILDNLDDFNKDKKEYLPQDGIILAEVTVEFYEGETVFDLLKRVTRENRIHMEFTNVPMYSSAYIEGIANLYEFDCGNLSGWMYKVNNIFPNYGVSKYDLKEGDKVELQYTCDLGRDLGCDTSGWQY